jgi:hypothetical protein
MLASTATVSFFVFRRHKEWRRWLSRARTTAPPRNPAATARPCKLPACAYTPHGLDLRTNMPRHTGNTRYYQIYTEIRYL